MSVLEADLRYQAGAFALEVALTLDAPWTAVFGPSGSGKTSLLECVAGLRRPQRGRIVVAGSTLSDASRALHVPPRDRRLGYVSQTLDLFPHLSVRRNVWFGAVARPAAPPSCGDRSTARPAPPGSDGSELPSRAVARPATPESDGPDPPSRSTAHPAPPQSDGPAPSSRGDRAAHPEDVLAILELHPLLDRLPARLSGGERQRVALARALLSEPDLLLLDEPLSALDAPLRRRILAYLAEVKRRIAIPCLYVTHNPEEVLALADHVVFLEKGRVVGQGQPSQVLSSPTSAADLGLEVENVLVLPVAASDESEGLTVLDLGAGQRLLIPYQPGARPGDRIRVGIRAGDCLLATGAPGPISARNVIPARVVEMVERGRDVYVRAQLASGEGADAANGQAISLWGCITPAALHQMGLTVAMDVTLLLKSHAVVVL